MEILLKNLTGIGPVTLKKLNENNIYTIKDLLFTFPKKYMVYEEDYELLYQYKETLISGKIINNPSYFKVRKAYCSKFILETNNNLKINCILFGNDYIRFKIRKDTNLSLYGKLNDDNEFLIKKVFFDIILEKIETDYKIKGIENYIIKKALNSFFSTDFNIIDELPTSLINKYKLLDAKKYLILSHNPFNKNDIINVLRRRKYEEFFWYCIRLEALKSRRYLEIKPKRIFDESRIDEFLCNLDFELSIDQKKTLLVIKNDILSDYPMNRLIQGDVGSGKTILAIIASYIMALSGYQSAIMVPTEILAQQHYNSFSKLFLKYNINVEILTSSTKNKDDIAYRLLNNRINIIIGTHSLLNEKIQFNKLGLIVIDEQHRFGVKQRAMLINKYKNIDCIYLSATPIPRTLGLTVFGDLDISSIHTKPNNRLDVITKIIDYNHIMGLMKSIKRELLLGHQIYVVVPLITDNNNDVITIDEAYELFNQYFNDYNIGLLHGKLSGIEKNKIIENFNSNLINILISTTVIEVGINVANATVMVIMDSDRFGLATLHQLRGRVGRSKYQSYCALVTKKVDNIRLRALEETNDGFEIAEKDLIQRGPGDYLGNDQSGHFSLDYSSFSQDFKIFECAKNDSVEYFKKFIKKEIVSNIFNDIINESGQTSKSN